MKYEDVVEFLHRVGVTEDSTSNKGWVRAPCPLAPWNHSSGTDAKPSFAIRVAPGDVSSCKCHSCGYHGTIPSMAVKFNLLRPTKGLIDFARATNEVDFEQLSDRTEDALRKFDGWGSPLAVKSKPKKEFVPTIYPNSFLDKYPRPSGGILEDLYIRRGLEDRTIYAWNLRYSRRSDRLIIPIWDVDKQLIGLSRRAGRNAQGPKYLHSKGFQRDHYLYGEHLVVKGEPGVIVEGFFHVMKLIQLGFPNVVATFGTAWSECQVSKIRSFFSEAIILPDGDPPGRAAAEKNWKTLKTSMQCHIADVPDDSDPGDYDFELAAKVLG